MNYVRRNIEEISHDPVLRIYGAMLAVLHVLAYLHWEMVHPLKMVLDPAGPAICWPFFEDCGEWRLLSQTGVERLLMAYYLFAVGTVLLFAKRKFTAVAWCALLGLNLFKSLILFQDYRLRLNQHYMTYWVTLAFLFVPYKRRVIPFLIVSFYFWAGTLKFTREWISGAALFGIKPLGVPESLIPASCVYVIFLEIVVAFGLLARNRWIFWSSMAQVVAFHIASWPIVGFFYPVLMFAILSIFPLARYIRDPKNPDQQPPLAVNLKSLFRGREHWSTYATLAAFCLCQMVPVVFPGDQSFTGEGRLFALHMFDSPLECRKWVTIYDREGIGRDIRLGVPFMTVRIRCDPVVYFSAAKGICNKLKQKDPSSANVRLHLETRRVGEKEYRTVIDQPDFCHAGLHYDLWRPNAWIFNPAASSQ